MTTPSQRAITPISSLGFRPDLTKQFEGNELVHILSRKSTGTNSTMSKPML